MLNGIPSRLTAKRRNLLADNGIKGGRSLPAREKDVTHWLLKRASSVWVMMLVSPRSGIDLIVARMQRRHERTISLSSERGFRRDGRLDEIRMARPPLGIDPMEDLCRH